MSRDSRLFSDARSWCGRMTWAAGARTGVWFFPGWATLTNHFCELAGRKDFGKEVGWYRCGQHEVGK